MLVANKNKTDTKTKGNNILDYAAGNKISQKKTLTSSSRSFLFCSIREFFSSISFEIKANGYKQTNTSMSRLKVLHSAISKPLLKAYPTSLMIFRRSDEELNTVRMIIHASLMKF
jgi:hypothetical protein